ncbi:MAG TPA: RecX family transcriptional regulator [Candidatus Saccharimonadales bacterium]|jgi:regulatory protein|nr:RecX family transcriptional regulator [Candidatus Saccharimonadales bacterium]
MAMTITAIKQQVKQAGRYSVFVDGKYSFSLSEVALLESGIHSGLELDTSKLAEFKTMSANDKAYGRALHYAMIRPRSEWELRTYLQRKQADPETAERIIAKLRRNDLVNDLAFARSWVASRRLLKATSRRRLTQELHQKRVSDDVIQQVLHEDETDERETLREIIAKKRQQSKYKADDVKLMQYLARQGYSYDDIKSVLQEEG